MKLCNLQIAGQISLKKISAIFVKNIEQRRQTSSSQRFSDETLST